MKKGLSGLAGRSGSTALGIFVVASLLFPSSPSVLCIAPGRHIAIEDINALCYVPSVISPRPGNPQDSRFDEPGSCNNCTDIFLDTNESGVLPHWVNFVISVQVDAEGLATSLSADLKASPCRSGVVGSTDSPHPASTSVLLRC
jgi:hypothetical protein